MEILIQDVVKTIDGNLIYWDETKHISSFVDFFDTPIKNCLYFLSKYEEDEDALITRLKNSEISGIVSKAIYEYNYDKWKEANIGVIEVKTISEAYYMAAAFYRQLFNIPFIEVTGSSGKTTTKEMISCILKQELETLESYENYNAPSGVAYNIFQLNDSHKACVLEAGMKGLGIINLSSWMIKPDIGIITSIQRAHLVSLGSIDKIIEAKAELLSNIKSNGYLLINGDDENIKKIPLKDFHGQIYRFGFSKYNDIYATDIEYKNNKTYFIANFYGYQMQCMINTFGKYNVANALAAIFVGLLLGVSKPNIVKGLSQFYPIKRHQEIINGINYSQIIFDNFNANPESTIQLIEEIPLISNSKKLVLIFGDIERPDDEIKDYAKKIHYEIGEKLSKINFDYLIGIGKWSIEYIKACENVGINRNKLIYFSTIDEVNENIVKYIEKNSLVILKAQKAYVDLKSVLDMISI